MTIEARIQEAIATGEVLTIRYKGGTQPGTIRNISPISISGKKVRARCLTSNAVKTFIVAKIELCEDVEGGDNNRYEPSKKNECLYDTLQSLYNNKLKSLEALGWCVCTSDSSISLHRRFKNGKLVKSADVIINYEEYTSDYVVDLDGELHEENIRKKQRPWMIRAKGSTTKSYGSLNKAAALFIEEAKTLAPNRKI